MLNKTDLVTEAELTKLENILRKLQPDAHLIKTTNAEVDINEVLDTGRFDFEQASNSAGWIKELTEVVTRNIHLKQKSMGLVLSFIQDNYRFTRNVSTIG